MIVLALTEKFLNEIGKISEFNAPFAGEVRFLDGKHLYSDVPSDFCISNYAFSELTRAVQDSYLEKVILKSKAGYMAWNCLSYEMLVRWLFFG